MKPPGLFAICCENSKCGDTSGCSTGNRSYGARYLQCRTEEICGERAHTASKLKTQFSFME